MKDNCLIYKVYKESANWDLNAHNQRVKDDPAFQFITKKFIEELNWRVPNQTEVDKIYAAFIKEELYSEEDIKPVISAIDDNFCDHDMPYFYLCGEIEKYNNDRIEIAACAPLIGYKSTNPRSYIITGLQFASTFKVHFAEIKKVYDLVNNFKTRGLSQGDINTSLSI